MGTTPIALAAAVGLLSCTPTEPCACPPARTHAVVGGQLRTEAGAPPDSASLRIEAASPVGAPCDFTRFAVLTHPESGVLVRGGTFTLRVFSESGPARRCVRVVAETRQAVLLHGRIDGAEIQFRPERDVPDTLTVLLVMRAPT